MPIFLSSDLGSLAIAFTYVSALVSISEVLHRLFHVSVDLTRKLVHIGVGMSAVAVTYIFRHWTIAIIGPLIFLGVNYVSHHRNLLAGIETGEARQYGTIYFPLSFVILTPLLWTQPSILAAAFMPMTWGDAAAAILGKRYGTRYYTVFGQTSSIEGSIAMFAFSFVLTLLVLVLFGQQVLLSGAMASVTALSATIAEALSPRGIDNLTVPIVSAVTILSLNVWVQ